MTTTAFGGNTLSCPLKALTKAWNLEVIIAVMNQRI